MTTMNDTLKPELSSRMFHKLHRLCNICVHHVTQCTHLHAENTAPSVQQARERREKLLPDRENGELKVDDLSH